MAGWLGRLVLGGWIGLLPLPLAGQPENPRRADEGPAATAVSPGSGGRPHRAPDSLWWLDTALRAAERLDDERECFATIASKQAEAGDGAGALATLARATSEDSAYIRACGVIARRQAADGDLDGALRTVERIVRSQLDATVLREIAVSQFRLGFQDDARETLGLMLNLRQKAVALCEMADRLRERGSPEDAAVLLAEAQQTALRVGSRRDRGAAVTRVVESYLAANRAEAAYSLLRAAQATLAPAAVLESLRLLVEAQVRAGDLPAARALLAAADEPLRSLWGAGRRAAEHCALARLHARTENLDQARSQLAQARTVAKDLNEWIEIMTLSARCNDRDGIAPCAAKVAAAIGRGDLKTHVAALCDLAGGCLQRSEREDAAAVLKAAELLVGQQADPQLRAALLCEVAGRQIQAGEKTAAHANLTQACRLVQDLAPERQADLLLRVARLQRTADDQAGGEATLQQALKIASAEPKVRLRIAEILAVNRKFDEAQAALRDAPQDAPCAAAVAQGASTLAVEQVRGGQVAAARETYRTFLEAIPRERMSPEVLLRTLAEIIEAQVTADDLAGSQQTFRQVQELIAALEGGWLPDDLRRLLGGRLPGLVAEAQAKSNARDAARATLRQARQSAERRAAIGAVGAKCRALGTLANERLGAGDLSSADRLMTEVTKLAEGRGDTGWVCWALLEFSAHADQASARDLASKHRAAARRLCAAATSPNRVHQELARQLAWRGDWQGAAQHLEAIPASERGLAAVEVACDATQGQDQDAARKRCFEAIAAHPDRDVAGRAAVVRLLQIENRDLAAAVAEQIENPGSRLGQLLEVGSALGGVTAEPLRDHILERARQAVAEIDAGKGSGQAEPTARSLSSDLIQLAELQGDGGDFARALKTATQIASAADRVRALTSVAQTQARMRDVTEALDTLRQARQAFTQVDEPSEQRAVAGVLFVTCLELGQLHDAEQFLPPAAVPPAWSPLPSCLAQLAHAYACRGDYAAAERILARLSGHRDSHDEAIRKLTELLAASGDEQGMRRFLAWLPEEIVPPAGVRVRPSSKWPADHAYLELLEAHVRAGLVDQALRAASAIRSRAMRVDGLRRIAAVQAEARDLVSARRTLDTAMQLALEISEQDADVRFTDDADARAAALRGLALAGIARRAGEYIGPRYPAPAPKTERFQGLSAPLSSQQIRQFRSAVHFAQYERAGREAVEACRKDFGPDDPRYAHALEELAAVCAVAGEHEKARQLYAEALPVRQRAADRQPEPYIRLLQTRGLLAAEAGQLAAARRWCQQAADLATARLGDEHPARAATTSSLASVLQQMGDFARAEALYTEALDLRRRLLGPEHLDYAVTAHNLGLLYLGRKDYVRAEQLLQEDQRITRKNLGQWHPDYAHSLETRAVLCTTMEKYNEAAPLLREAADVYRNTLGSVHPSCLRVQNNLGVLYRESGDYVRASQALEEALTQGRRALGGKHPLVIDLLTDLALLEFSRRQPERAVTLVREALAVTHETLDTSFAVQSEREQLATLAALRDRLDLVLSLLGQGGLAAEEAYQEVLRWKGVVFAAQRLRRAWRADPQVAPQFLALEETSRRLAALAFAAVPLDQRLLWQEQVRRLAEQKEQLESQVAQRRAGSTTPSAGPLVSLAEWRQTLPKDGVLLDFLEFNAHRVPDADQGRRTRQRRLLAFIVTRDRPVKPVDLGPMEAIEQAVDAWREAIIRGTAATDDGPRPPAAGGLPGRELPAQTVRRLVWEPLAPAVAGARLVLVSPDGVLARCPLVALPGHEGNKTLLEETPLALVAVPRLLPELLRTEDRRPSGAAAPPATPSLLLIGSVDFDAAPGGLPVAPAVAPPASDSGGQGGFGFHFSPLPGTAAEMQLVERLFRDARQGTTTSLRAAEATAAAFCRAAPGKRYLHLATHGFFAADAPGSAENPPASRGAVLRTSMLGDDARQVLIGLHPGLRSGLALAGANREVQAVPDPKASAEAGILTALEVAELDLRESELVVLSACETGLGRVAGGEGLLGLQRAFQVAGARAVIASLWQVDDQATQTLMVEFYRNLWEKKLGKLESLRQAQLTLLQQYNPREGGLRGVARVRDPRAAKPSEALPPRYWAAFTLSGDWR